MLRIAICDDDELFLIAAKALIKKYYLENMDKTIECNCFLSAEEVMESLKEVNYDFVFIDIEMPNQNGIDLANYVIENCTNKVVFVTGREDFVFEAIKIHPFAFIRKRHFEKEIAPVLKDITNIYYREKKFLEIHSGAKLIRLNICDILYFESIKNQVEAVTVDAKHTFRKTMQELETELKHLGFIRVHIGYLVNFSHIRQINRKNLTLDNGIVIPISRTKQKDVQREYRENVLNL